MAFGTFCLSDFTVNLRGFPPFFAAVRAFFKHVVALIPCVPHLPAGAGLLRLFIIAPRYVSGKLGTLGRVRFHCELAQNSAVFGGENGTPSNSRRRVSGAWSCRAGRG